MFQSKLFLFRAFFFVPIYLWNIVLQGSGVALVPNSLKTILWAAIFLLYTSVWMNLRW